MIKYILNKWHQVSRTGLYEDEGVLDHRDVILLNRALAILPIVLILYTPLEIYFNGFSLLYLVGIMIVLFLLPLWFNKYRWFTVSRYFIFFIGILVVMFTALFVGKGANNHVTFIPIMLLGVIIFKQKITRILVLIFTCFVFFLQLYLLEHVEPSIEVSDEVKSVFSNIFFILAVVITYLLGHYFIQINEEFEGVILKQKKESDVQRDLIEEKNKEIVDSIAYAKRIQTAILPPEKLIRENLKNSFVLYKPKDIVAGDFYWLEQVDGKVLFAAADCTGHGVPGAMVSLICNHGLNRSVREFGNTEPGKILDQTRELVIEEFIKSEEDVKDGMDVALCSLEGNVLQFAGAHNPLWIIRKDANEVEEVKANKQPIGKFDSPTPYETHSIHISDGDTFYIFSDGFADQFGGEKGKKFKSANFKRLLLAIQHESMDKQCKIIEDAFEDWRGEIEQIDDVCVIGVRI